MSEWCSKDEIGSVAFQWPKEEIECFDRTYHQGILVQIQVWAVPGQYCVGITATTMYIVL